MGDRFRDKPWDERFKSMGDQAEGEFERQHTGWARFGFNRPDLNMSANSAVINYAPDYVFGMGPNVLVEVQGCGADQWFKFKDDKLQALKRWQTFSEMKTYFWLWDAHNERAFWISIDELRNRTIRLVDYKGERGSFSEGKTFVKFQAETFTLENK